MTRLWNTPKKVLPIFEKVLGTEHPYTATTYHNIALVYKALDDYDKALEFAHKSEHIYEVVCGTEHPYTKQAYRTLALLYLKKYDMEKCAEYLMKAGNSLE